MGLIVDSSVAIGYERQGLSAADMIVSLRSAAGTSRITLSTVTVMELEHGIWRALDPGRARKRQQFLDDLVGAIHAYPVTTAIARRAGRVDADLKAQGIQVAVSDLLIGTTALELGYSVATRNARDFAVIPGLTVVTL